ncbi:hypothetical protein [Streptomyces sp. KL116D]|uniref:hypothetical protein n=1 Tax=Streptomyces sp. KL116D TaxID=3045152 RepID=UPI003556FDD4
MRWAPELVVTTLGSAGGAQRRVKAESAEVAEVAHRELCLVAGACVVDEGGGPGKARVVDEDVQRVAGFQVPGDEGVDRLRVEQVEAADLDAREPGDARAARSVSRARR